MDPVALDRSARLAALAGFSRTAFPFGYGLAEHTLVAVVSPSATRPGWPR